MAKRTAAPVEQEEDLVTEFLVLHLRYVPPCAGIAGEGRKDPGHTCREGTAGSELGFCVLVGLQPKEMSQTSICESCWVAEVLWGLCCDASQLRVCSRSVCFASFHSEGSWQEQKRQRAHALVGLRFLPLDFAG